MKTLARVLVLASWLWGVAAVVTPGWAQEHDEPTAPETQETEDHGAAGSDGQAHETTGSAAGEPAGGVLHDLGIEPRLLVVNIAGFVILLILLSKFLYAPITGLLRERSEGIRNDLEEAERQRREMEELRAEYEQHLARIEQEARDRLQETMQQAHAVRDQLLEETRAEAERTRERVMEEMHRERDKLRVELRDEVVEISITAAERIIERSLDAEAHRAVIDDLFEKTVSQDGPSS